jgi:hypothetical protein
MIPVARKENLVIQEFEDELIIADNNGNSAHCLSPIAARVWEYCDGYNTIDDIANLVEDDLDIPLDRDVDMRGLIWITLEELQRYGLIKEYLNKPLNQPISDANLSRRKMLKRLSIAGGFAAGTMFPAVRSMMMPEPAMSASPSRPKCPKKRNVTSTSTGTTESFSRANGLQALSDQCVTHCMPCPGGVFASKCSTRQTGTDTWSSRCSGQCSCGTFT